MPSSDQERGGGEVTLQELAPPEDLLTKVRTLSVEDVRFVLPTHRGLMLLLDKVTIYPRSKASGELQVTPERCVGFCFKKQEELILRGVDLVEMAAQLLGVWGSYFREIFKERRREFVLASFGRAEFHKPIKVGETVVIEIAVDRIRVRGDARSQQFVIKGEEFIIKVNEELRGRISGITLMSTPLQNS